MADADEEKLAEEQEMRAEAIADQWMVDMEIVRVLRELGKVIRAQYRTKEDRGFVASQAEALVADVVHLAYKSGFVHGATAMWEFKTK